MSEEREYLHRYVCERCDAVCRLDTEALKVPWRCPIGLEADWYDPDEEEGEE